MRHAHQSETKRSIRLDPAITLPQQQTAQRRWVSSPKLAKSGRSSYQYYAAYSEAFVRDILTSWNLGSDEAVLDPWNGSGTTTRVAAELGLRAFGVDLNPAMAVVSKARLVDIQEAQDAGKFLTERTHRRPSLIRWSNDPLRYWFEDYSASLVRSLAVLCADVRSTPRESMNVEQLTPRQAFLLTALFVTIRRILTSFVGSNPTWTRFPRSAEDRVSIDWKTLRSRLLESTLLLQADAFGAPVARSRITLTTGSAASLPTGIPRISLVLGSPPYCTRIDYAVATRLELSLLAIPIEEQDKLRRRLLGATTVPSVLRVDSGKIGPTALRLLTDVWSHSAKASRTYYFKWLAQYISDYASCLAELTSRCQRESSMVLVVQDSWYKDIRIDLPQITREMLGALGWTAVENHRFHLPVTMAGVNPGSRQYRHEFSATEDVLIFRRGHQ